MPSHYFNRLALLILLFVVGLGPVNTDLPLLAQGKVSSAKKQKRNHQPSSTSNTMASPFTAAVLRSPTSRIRRPVVPLGDYATNEEIQEYAPDVTNDIYTKRPSWRAGLFEELAKGQESQEKDVNGNLKIKSAVSDFTASAREQYTIHEGKPDERKVRIWDIDHVVKFEYLRTEARRQGVSYDVYKAINFDATNLRLLTYKENRSHTYEDKDKELKYFDKTEAKRRAKELVDKHVEIDRKKQENQQSKKRRRDEPDGN